MMNNYLKLERKVVALLAFTCLVWVSAQAQQSVSGKVTDASDGSGIPGVNVIEQGTTNGTITDFDGNYQVSVSQGATLVFSYVGYVSQEIAVGTQSVINAGLELDVQSLAEVVVVGYGTVEARDATGAVVSVKEESFNKGVISSPEELIQGRVAGVQITTASGEPGAGINVRIRGTTSVRANNNPLFVVDGVPLSGQETTSGSDNSGFGSQAARNPLNFLNPNDIASMDILKDASATAIYGSRGANGVIIITTKSGQAGKGVLNYNYSLGVGTMAKKYDLLGADEFLAAYADFNGQAAANQLDGGADVDYQDELTRTAFTHSHNLSFAGGSEKSTYNFSFGWFDQQGIVKKTGLQRATARFSGSTKFIDDKLTLSTQLTMGDTYDQSTAITDNSGFRGDLWGNVLKANPTTPVRQPDGSYTQPGVTEPNPVAINDLSTDFTESIRGLGNITLAWDITEDLEFKTLYGFDRSISERRAAYSRDLVAVGIQNSGRAFFNDIQTDNTLWENYFTYKNNFGNGKLEALLGYSYQEFDRSTKAFEVSNFRTSDLNLMLNNLASADHNAGRSVVARNSSKQVDELQSFFGRVNLNFSEKYLITATLRADGSTRFGPGNQYGYFPSAAFKWRIAEEGFLPSVFSDMALRVGFGIVGNQEIPHNLYQTRQRYNDWDLNENNDYFGGGLGDVAFANPDLKWESSQQFNVALEYGFIDNRLRGSLEWYYKTTKDLLIQTVAAQPAVQPFVWQNLDADVVNTGVEFSIEADAVESTDFRWDIVFNIAYNDNEVQNFGGLINTGDIDGQGLTGAFAQRIAGDQPLFAYFLREFDGFDENGISIYAGGDFQKFLDGKGPIPRTTMGLTNTFTYKNLDLSFFFTGQYGFWIYDNTANAYFTAGSLANGRNVRRDVVGNGEGNLNAPEVSTRFLEKGDFTRLQNLTLGYNFDMSNSGAIGSLRIYLAGQNLFVITDYNGQDPEVNVNKPVPGIEIPSLGIDYTTYPRARTFTFGLDVSF